MEILNPNGYHPHYNTYREGLLRRSKEYYQKHKEEIKKKKLEIYYEQKAKKTSYQREYHRKNKEKCNRQRAARYRNKFEAERLMSIAVDLFE